MEITLKLHYLKSKVEARRPWIPTDTFQESLILNFKNGVEGDNGRIMEQ